MDESEVVVLAYMAFPARHRTRLHSSNPLEHLNKKVKRRADMVGIFPNDASVLRLIGAVLFEKNADWQSPTPLHDIRSLQPDRRRTDRPASKHNHTSCLTDNPAWPRRNCHQLDGCHLRKSDCQPRGLAIVFRTRI